MAKLNLMNEKQAAEYLGLAVSTLQKRRHMHLAPPYVRMGRRIGYLEEDLVSFALSGRVDPEAN